jgi:hypothetical protein
MFCLKSFRNPLVQKRNSVICQSHKRVSKTVHRNPIKYVKEKIPESTLKKVRVVEIQGGGLATTGLLFGTLIGNMTGHSFVEQVQDNILPISVLIVSSTIMFTIPAMRQGGYVKEDKMTELKMSRLSMIFITIIFFMDYLWN